MAIQSLPKGSAHLTSWETRGERDLPRVSAVPGPAAEGSVYERPGLVAGSV
jgi:hypothetical protein